MEPGNTRDNGCVNAKEKNKSKIDVIVIDGPECSSHRSRHSRTSLKPNKKFFSSRVIIIDEDNDDFSHSRKAEESTSGSMNSHFQLVVDSDSDECQDMKGRVHVENPTWIPIFSEDSARSALTDSDSSSSCESDSDSGCEVINDFSSDIRKDWEKAYMTKKKERQCTRSSMGWGEFTSHDESSLNNAEVEKSSCEEKCRGKTIFSHPDEDRCKSKAESTILPCSSWGGKASLGILREIVVEEQMPGSDEQLVLENVDNISNFQNDAIGERDKHKESEEYRLAQEEEWAARREQIRIQQEEAQRLRKKKKAQTLRLLDMERRQKQRIEEIRESHKRDKETIDLKDNLRSKIRKELEGLEVKHKGSASLLRALGINVRGGSSPPSFEVNAAFKQALFRFHPDRASKTDIKEQVEAEEKFKLISRLRQRLPPVA